MNAREAALFAGVEYSTVLRWIKTGKLATRRQGRSWVIDPTAIIALSGGPGMATWFEEVSQRLTQIEAHQEQTDQRITQLEQGRPRARFTPHALALWLAGHGPSAATTEGWIREWKRRQELEFDDEAAAKRTAAVKGLVQQSKAPPRDANHHLRRCHDRVEPHCLCATIFPE